MTTILSLIQFFLLTIAQILNTYLNNEILIISTNSLVLQFRGTQFKLNESYSNGILSVIIGEFSLSFNFAQLSSAETLGLKEDFLWAYLNSIGYVLATTGKLITGAYIPWIFHTPDIITNMATG